MVLSRGPARKSAKQRRAEGNPGRRPMLEDVIAPAGAPEKPTDLSPEASAEWDRIVEEMAAVKTLATTDRAAIVQYICLWEDARRARLALADGFSTMDKSGCLKARPETTILLRSTAQMVGLLDRFGLNPAARAKIKVSTGPVISDRLREFLTERVCRHRPRKEDTRK